MKHFALAEWADFVRGIAKSEQSAAMQKHLDENCSRCAQDVRMWTSVVGFAQQEVTYEPPPSALRIAKSYFAALQLASRQTRALQLATRTFDSFEGQTVAGLRGSGSVAQQLMYQCGSVIIDLRMEPKPSTRSITLAGQVVDSGPFGGGLGGIPVSLHSEEATWLKTTTNGLGEFHFSFSPTPHLELVFGIEDSAVLVLLPDAVGIA